MCNEQRPNRGQIEVWRTPLSIPNSPLRETTMDARKVAAQFAAFTWYEETHAGQHSPEEATSFAEQNWAAFLPVAREGLGRLLLRLAAPRSRPRRMKRRCLAVAS
jgi:hypothetical protein